MIEVITKGMLGNSGVVIAAKGMLRWLFVFILKVNYPSRMTDAVNAESRMTDAVNAESRITDAVNARSRMEG